MTWGDTQAVIWLTRQDGLECLTMTIFWLDWKKQCLDMGPADQQAGKDRGSHERASGFNIWASQIDWKPLTCLHEGWTSGYLGLGTACRLGYSCRWPGGSQDGGHLTFGWNQDGARSILRKPPCVPVFPVFEDPLNRSWGKDFQGHAQLRGCQWVTLMFKWQRYLNGNCSCGICHPAIIWFSLPQKAGWGRTGYIDWQAGQFIQGYGGPMLCQVLQL